MTQVRYELFSFFVLFFFFTKNLLSLFTLAFTVFPLVKGTRTKQRTHKLETRKKKAQPRKSILKDCHEALCQFTHTHTQRRLLLLHPFPSPPLPSPPLLLSFRNKNGRWFGFSFKKMRKDV